jgi:hypothetical protein
LGGVVVHIADSRSGETGGPLAGAVVGQIVVATATNTKETAW